MVIKLQILNLLWLFDTLSNGVHSESMFIILFGSLPLFTYCIETTSLAFGTWLFRQARNTQHSFQFGIGVVVLFSVSSFVSYTQHNTTFRIFSILFLFSCFSIFSYARMNVLFLLLFCFVYAKVYFVAFINVCCGCFLFIICLPHVRFTLFCNFLLFIFLLLLSMLPMFCFVFIK